MYEPAGLAGLWGFGDAGGFGGGSGRGEFAFSPPAQSVAAGLWHVARAELIVAWDGYEHAAGRQRGQSG